MGGIFKENLKEINEGMPVGSPSEILKGENPGRILKLFVYKSLESSLEKILQKFLKESQRKSPQETQERPLKQSHKKSLMETQETCLNKFREILTK